MKFEVQQWADDIRSRVANLRAAGTQEESYTKMETCGERTTSFCCKWWSRKWKHTSVFAESVRRIWIAQYIAMMLQCMHICTCIVIVMHENSQNKLFWNKRFNAPTSGEVAVIVVGENHCWRQHCQLFPFLNALE